MKAIVFLALVVFICCGKSPVSSEVKEKEDPVGAVLNKINLSLENRSSIGRDWKVIKIYIGGALIEYLGPDEDSNINVIPGEGKIKIYRVRFQNDLLQKYLFREVDTTFMVAGSLSIG